MLKLFKANLTLFDGGNAAGGEGAMGGGNGNEGQAEAQPAKAGKTTGEYDNVVFGKQPEVEPAGNVEEAKPNKPTEPSPEERQKAYDEFIKANKDLYQKDFQKSFDRRHADYKELREKFGKADKLIGLLAERYGESNVDKLEELISNDTRLLEEEALEKGIPVEQLIQIRNLKREADIERSKRERIETQIRGEEQYRAWLEESEKVKTAYPDFDLNSEIQNPQFISLLKSGVAMDHAYKVLHYNELMENNVSQAMQKSAKATADSIAARGSRPKENAGSASNSGVIYKTDVSSLTAKDREEIARRVARGEKISF